MFMNLQPGIRKGNPRAIEAGIKVLGDVGRLNGYAAPQKHELTGKNGKPLTLVQLLEAVGPLPEEEEKYSLATTSFPEIRKHTSTECSRIRYCSLSIFST
jgi:hypothetical protein